MAIDISMKHTDRIKFAESNAETLVELFEVLLKVNSMIFDQQKTRGYPTNKEWNHIVQQTRMCNWFISSILNEIPELKGEEE